MVITRLLAAVLLTGSAALAQTTNDPFPTPIPATDGVIKVRFAEFASLPDVDGERRADDASGRRAGHAPALRQRHARPPLQRQLQRPDRRRRIWICAIPRGPSSIQSQGNERGFQSFAFHPQFNRRGAPGFGKFYTYTDTSNTAPAAGLHARRRQQHTRHDSAGMDREGSQRGDLRWRPAARAAALRTTVCQPQRRAHHLQPARLDARRRFRTALRRRCRRRQRRRPTRISRRT